jgi:Cdc6-like AAA superfamily ATPase
MPVDNAAFYVICNLTENPFRSNATFDDDPRVGIWAGQTSEQRQLQKFLLRSRAEQVGNTNLILLYGHYGTGKSHALLWGIHWLKHSDAVAQSAAYYIPTLKKDKGKLTFAGAFQDDLIAKTTLVKDVLMYRHHLQKCIAKHTSENDVSTGMSANDIIERLIPAVDLHVFAKDLFNQDTEDRIRQFLTPRGQTDYQAMVTFTRVANLFVYEMRFKNEVKRFRQSVHLMIDELDVLLNASTKEILEVNDLIRHIYDLCPNCFGLVLAVSAEQEILNSIFAEYVLTRVTRQIEFKPFDRAAAVEFSIQVMDNSRREETNPALKGAFPFTPEALEAVLGQLTNRTPRKVVNVMQQIIEEARLRDLAPSNGPITVSQLDASGIMEEIL